jgi:hypothetical protein
MLFQNPWGEFSSEPRSLIAKNLERPSVGVQSAVSLPDIDPVQVAHDTPNGLI